MSASVMTTRDAAANPLDIMEQIVTANDWIFDRRGEGEMVAEAPGRWCDYGLHFNWSPEISTMHFTCTFDLKVPEKQRGGLYELLALANERLWIGHFGIEREDGVPVYRHAVLLRGAPGASARARQCPSCDAKVLIPFSSISTASAVSTSPIRRSNATTTRSPNAACSRCAACPRMNRWPRR